MNTPEIQLIIGILFVILLVALLLKRRKTAIDYALLAIVGLQLASYIGKILSIWFAGYPDVTALLLTGFGNVLCYSCLALSYMGFALLVYYAVTGTFDAERTIELGDYSPGDMIVSDNSIVRALALLIVAIGLLSEALVIYSYFTDTFLTMTASNVAVTTPEQLLLFNLMGIQVLLVLPMVIISVAPKRMAASRTPQKHEGDDPSLAGVLSQYFLYALLPLAAVVYTNMRHDMMVVFPACALALLMMYINAQRTQEQLLAKRELQLAKSQTSVLMQQIKPHFISNSLLAIQQLCVEDPKQAKKAVQTFSSYLRQNFQIGDSDELVPFYEELQHIETYLDLERIDPAIKFTVEYDIRDDEFVLPPLTVQPLVENAVKHGVNTRKAGDGVIRITTREDKDGYYVDVHDNGVGFQDTGVFDERPANRRTLEGTGIGLQNVRRRLALQCDGTLDITSDGSGTTSTIFLPRETQR